MVAQAPGIDHVFFGSRLGMLEYRPLYEAGILAIVLTAQTRKFPLLYSNLWEFSAGFAAALRRPGGLGPALSPP